MRYSNEERETTCVFDYIDNKWEVYSCVPRHMSRLRKITEPYWEEIDPETKRVTAAKWNLNGNQVRFAIGTVAKRTPEQIEASRSRLAAYHEKRKVANTE